MSWLEIRDLDFHRDGKCIFRRFRFLGDQRGIYLCSGNSGIGKSTLGLLLAGHLRAEAGTIRVGDEEVGGPSRKRVLVSQGEDLFPWLRSRRQVDFFREVSGSGEDTDQLLRMVGLEEAAGLYPHELSTGMKKRLSLIRALALRPALIVLDETLSPLEPQLRENILEKLAVHLLEREMGAVIISHDPLPLAEGICKGRILIT